VATAAAATASDGRTNLRRHAQSAGGAKGGEILKYEIIANKPTAVWASLSQKGCV